MTPDHNLNKIANQEKTKIETNIEIEYFKPIFEKILTDSLNDLPELEVKNILKSLLKAIDKSNIERNGNKEIRLGEK